MMVRLLFRGQAVMCGKEIRSRCGEHAYLLFRIPLRDVFGQVGRVPMRYVGVLCLAFGSVFFFLRHTYGSRGVLLVLCRLILVRS